MRTLFGWLGRRWEPLVAIAALAVSGWSAYLGLKSLDMAAQSAEISVSAQRSAERLERIGRMPIMVLVADLGKNTLMVENNGHGPGYIYQMELAYNDIRQSITLPENRLDHDEMLKQFAIAAISQITGRDSKSAVSSVSSPLTVYRPDTPRAILTFKTDSTISKQAIREFWDNVTIRACYMDLVGEFRASHTRGPSGDLLGSCNKDARPYVIVN